MFTFFVIIHALICVLLVIVVLMQAGRGGGLTETFSSAESVFGAQTSAVMTKTTSILGALFIISSLNITFLSLKKEKSLMESMPDVIEKNLPQLNAELPATLPDAAAVEQKVISDEKAQDVTNALNSFSNAIQ